MLTNLCEIRNLCEMSDCSEGNSVLLYLDNRVGKPPTNWCQSTVSYGQRSFSYSSPSAWNSLPQQVRSSDNVSTFRSRTKTHLFRLAY